MNIIVKFQSCIPIFNKNQHLLDSFLDSSFFIYFIYSLLNSAFRTWSSMYRMMGIGYGLSEVQEFSWRDWEKYEKSKSYVSQWRSKLINKA